MFLRPGQSLPLTWPLSLFVSLNIYDDHPTQSRLFLLSFDVERVSRIISKQFTLKLEQLSLTVYY